MSRPSPGWRQRALTIRSAIPVALAGSRRNCWLLLIVCFGAALVWLVQPTPASADVGPTGAFTTSVPIQVPTFHGLQPALSLRYSSQSGDGWLGEGWTLDGTSLIARQSGVHGVPSWTDADHYTLDGNDLVACAGGSDRVTASPSCAHSVAGTTGYTTTIETFERVAFITGSDGGTWTVWRTNGDVMTYQPVTWTSHGVLDWRIATMRDPSGNTVTYHWTQTAGHSAELTAISYADVVLAFTTEPRPDRLSASDGGALLKLDDRLKLISESAGGSPVRSYRLSYQTHADRSRESFLSSVQEVGSDGVTTYPATSYAASVGHAVTATTAARTAALTGLDSANWPSGPADSGRWNAALAGGQTGHIPWSTGGWLTGDLNRDERQDIVHVQTITDADQDDDVIQVTSEINADSGGYQAQDSYLRFAWPQDPLPAQGLTPAQQTHNEIRVAAAHAQLADVNGDGYPDLVLTVKESTGNYIAVAFNTAPSGHPGQFTAGPAALTSLLGDENREVFVADVTGDGEGDLVVETSLDTRCAGGAASLQTFPGDGTGHFATSVPVSCLPADTHWSAAPNLSPLDLNGDLKTDFAAYVPADHTSHLNPGPTTARIVSAVSRGDGTFATRDFDTGQDWAADHQEGGSCDPDSGAPCVGFRDVAQPGVWGTFDTRPGTDLTVLTEPVTTGCTLQHGTTVAHVFSSNGDGTFTRRDRSTTLPAGAFATIYRTHDGDLDCVRPTKNVDITRRAPQLQVADVNGDGLSDLVVATSDKTGDTITSVSRLDDDGDTGFRYDGAARTVNWAVMGCSTVINGDCAKPLLTVGDVNGDGRDDVSAISGQVGGQATTASDVSSSGPSLAHVLTGDVNGDGRTDDVSVVMDSDTTVQVRASLGTADGGFQPTTAVTLRVSDVGLIHLPADGWRLVDLTGDHRADLINLPPGQRSGLLLVATDDGGWADHTITLNGLDRTTTAPPPTPSPTPTPTRSPHPRPSCTYGGPGHHVDCNDDFDASRDVLSDDLTTAVGDTTVQPALLPAIGTWQFADVNGDGITDVVHAGPGAAPWNETGVLVLGGSRDGDLSMQWTAAPDAATATALAKPLQWHTGDVNGDGRADLIDVNSASGATRTLMQRDGSWSVVTNTDQSGGSTCLPRDKFCQRSPELTLGVPSSNDDAAWTPLDVNGDGNQDLVRVVPEGNRLDTQSLISRGDGTFERVDDLLWSADLPSADTLADGDTENWQPTDLDLDGRGDLVKATQTDGTLRVRALLSDGTGQWSYRTWTTSVTPGGTAWQVQSDAGPVVLAHLIDASSPSVQEVSSAAAPDTIAHIDNGLGATTSISYRSGSSFLPAHGLVDDGCTAPEGSTPYVVTSLRTDVATPAAARIATTHGGLAIAVGEGATQTTTDSSSFRYDCPRYSTPLRTFLGWRDSWTTHAAASQSTGASRPSSTEHVTRAVDLASGIDQVILDETSGAGGLLQQTTTTYQPVGPAAPYLDQAIRTDTGPCDARSCADTSTTRAYDSDGNVTRQVDTAAGTGAQRITDTTYLYDDDLWLHDQPAETSVSGRAGPDAATVVLQRTRTCYDDDTSPDCHTPQGVDARGLVTATRAYADGSDTWLTTHTYQHDQFGNIVRATDPDGHPSSTSYDAAGIFPVRTCNALHQCATTSDWNRVSEQPGLTVALNGGRTSTHTDSLGRTDLTVGPTGIRTATRYQFGPAGTTTTVTTRAGALSEWTSTSTDGLGHTVRTRTPGADGHVVQTDTLYLDATLPALKTAPHDSGVAAGNWSATSYDALSRPTRTTHADGASATIGYSIVNGFAVTTSTPENNHEVTTRAIDGWGKAITVSQASVEHPGTSASTTYTYDALGRETAMTDPHHNTERLTYNSLGQEIVDDDPDRGRTTYQYDPSGLVTSTTDARGRITTKGYDALGRLTTSTDHTTHQIRTWTYDTGGPTNTGHLTAETDASATGCRAGRSHQWTYDVLGDVTRTTQCTGGLSATTRTAYDALGRPRTLTYPDGLTVTNVYNAAGAVVAIPRYVNAISYTAVGAPSTISYANHTRDSYSYSTTRGWLISHVVTNTTTGGRLFDESYNHDAAGNILTATSTTNDQHERFGYNALDELTTVTNTANGRREQSLSYDDIGNIASNSSVGSYRYPSARSCGSCSGPDAATTIGGHRYTYDADGDTVTDRLGAATTSYTWTTDGMVATIHSAGGTTTNAYDADDDLVQATSGGRRATYVGDLTLHTSSGWRDTIYLGSAVIAEHTAASTSWDTTDHLGSIRAVTNRDGHVVSRTNYSPFGLTVGKSAPTDHGYTAAHAVTGTSLINLNARDYAPTVGRFLSADTIRPGDTALGANRYSYTTNNPVNHIDPSGHADSSQTSCTAQASCTDLSSWNSFVAVGNAYFAGGPSAFYQFAGQQTTIEWQHADTPTPTPDAGITTANVLPRYSGALLTDDSQPQSPPDEDFWINATAVVRSAGARLLDAGMSLANAAFHHPGDTANFLIGQLMAGSGTIGFGAGLGLDLTGVGAAEGVPLGAASADLIVAGNALSAYSAGQLVTHALTDNPVTFFQKLSGDDLGAPAEPYRRPFGTTAAQRASVQGKPCWECGALEDTMVADHIDPLVEEYMASGGKIDAEAAKSVDAVRPQCPVCSARQGGELAAFSRLWRAVFFGY